MFAYCNNNPVGYYDATGDSAIPIPTLADFYGMHKAVQYDIAEEYGYAIEVFVSGYKGRGFLDIFDAENNQYYEVKSITQAGTWTTTQQMEKYDVSHIRDIRFLGYFFADSPQRGERMNISGMCQYSYWDIHYSSNGNGLITYTWVINQQRYQAHLAKLMAMTTVAIAGCGVMQWISNLGDRNFSYNCMFQ